MYKELLKEMQKVNLEEAKEKTSLRNRIKDLRKELEAFRKAGDKDRVNDLKSEIDELESKIVNIKEDGTWLASPQPPTPVDPEIPEEDPAKKREGENRTLPVNFGIAGV